VAGDLGVMTEELDETGGLDIAKANEWLSAQHEDLLMVGAISAAPLYGGMVVETTLDPAQQPFLFDHSPDAGTPWLPGVMAIESMAEAATLLTPGWNVSGVENVEMLGAFKYFHDKPRTFYLHTVVEPEGEATLRARVVLRSITPPARQGLPTRVQDHFRSQVQLTPLAPERDPILFTPPLDEALPIPAATIYKTFFHGPAYQVIERAAVMEGRAQGRFPAAMPPNSNPADAPPLMAPRLVELCFQTAALWSMEVKEEMAFPLGVDKLVTYHQESVAGDRRLFTIVQTNDGGETFDARVVDEAGRRYVDLNGYRTITRPGLPE